MSMCHVIKAVIEVINFSTAPLTNKKTHVLVEGLDFLSLINKILLFLTASPSGHPADLFATAPGRSSVLRRWCMCLVAGIIACLIELSFVCLISGFDLLVRSLISGTREYAEDRIGSLWWRKKRKNKKQKDEGHARSGFDLWSAASFLGQGQILI